MSTQLNVAQIPREFVRCWGDHDRIPKAIYLRLASLIAVAKSLARSDELADELRARAQQVQEEGQWGDARRAALELSLVEQRFLPKRRAEAVADPVVVGEPSGRWKVKTVPGKRVEVSLGNDQPKDHVNALGEAIAEFVDQWLTTAPRGRAE